MNAPDDLPFSPAAERNQGPILAQLQAVLPPQGHALEIASGTGQHALHFAAGLPGWHWQMSDPDPQALSTLQARRARADAALQARLGPPRALDVHQPDWLPPGQGVDLVFCANLLHIAPWSSCAALMQGAARVLRPAGVLITYGPYVVADQPTAPSNLAFDADLKARNPAWGLRALDAVAAEAQAAGLQLQARHALPANNLLLVWGRRPAGPIPT